MELWRQVVTICLVMVWFQWDANTEPDMSYYRLYQRTGNVVICIQPYIKHPKTTVGVEISREDLANSTYFLTAVDTEGMESGPSNEVICDQACIDKYLKPRKLKGIGLE